MYCVVWSLTTNHGSSYLSVSLNTKYLAAQESKEHDNRVMLRVSFRPNYGPLSEETKRMREEEEDEEDQV